MKPCLDISDSLGSLGPTTSVAGVQQVYDSVREKFQGVTRKSQLIQLPEHGLTLIVLAEIICFQCDPSVDLVHLDGEIVFYPLNSQILSHALELVYCVGIIALILPFAL